MSTLGKCVWPPCLQQALLKHPLHRYQKLLEQDEAHGGLVEDLFTSSCPSGGKDAFGLRA